ncbi:EAL domain-containing protein [Neorhizobium sp. NCHU2750]|uniref:EAL domain-containing protein n=1 Tax=Neorhizobium sp. NCHU2750 TaxID=1825976 RepID=UPI000E75D418|nr:diguanylate cyclase [Neorhizobium sp. NCHU2750]
MRSQRLYCRSVAWLFLAASFLPHYAYADANLPDGHQASAGWDAAWIAMTAACLLFIQAGSLLFGAGMRRATGLGAIAQINLLALVLAVIGFAAVGFNIAFGQSHDLPFGTAPVFSVLHEGPFRQAGVVLYQSLICAVAAIILSSMLGARLSPRQFIPAILVFSAVIYPLFLHFAHGDLFVANVTAFLSHLDFVDLAGGVFLHATAGWVALAAAIVFMAPKGQADASRPTPRRIAVSIPAGALILAAGWTSLNGVFALVASADVATVVKNSLTAAAAGASLGAVIGLRDGQGALLRNLCIGALGGLSASTAGSALLELPGAIFVGIAGAAIAMLGNRFVTRQLRVHDPAGLISIHAFAGAAGALLLSVAAPLASLPAGGRIAQLWVQAVGIGIDFYWSFGAAYLLFRLSIRLPVVGRRPVADAGDDTSAAEWSLPFDESERVAALAKATFEAIMIHRNGIVVDGNDELAKLAGRPLDDLIGRSIFEFLRDGEAIRVSEIVKLNDDARHEISIELPDGSTVPVAARGRDIVFRGEKARVGCFVDLRERRQAEKRIRHLAQHDPLTGLPNRVLFTERLTEMMERADGNRAFGVVIIDVDRFKDINDIHGHQAGDAVIYEVAARFAALAGDHDVVARLAGDEFAVILAEVLSVEELEAFGRNILGAMAVPIDIRPEEQVNVTVSIGTALFPDDAMEIDALIGCADVALHHAKTSGRNAMRRFLPGMNDLINKRRALERDLEQALHLGQFELYLQPRICVEDLSVSGHEALLRWTHPTRGMVSPADFIPVAEASGKIIQLGEWVLEEAVRLLDRVEGHISVNVSPLQFRHADFVARLARLLEQSGTDPGRIELEITESVLIDDHSRALQILTELKRMGFTIALDDFGTGYSSLSYLSHYPFDTIKIDRSFVQNLSTAEKTQLIVRTIIDLGEALGMKVVAEGVETIEEAAFLSRFGCHELQGYLLGRPSRIAELQKIVAPRLAAQLQAVQLLRRRHVSADDEGRSGVRIAEARA